MIVSNVVMFPSRNRGSFGFKVTFPLPAGCKYVIRFNLVIEVLLISRQGNWILINLNEHVFQSRNRDSFGFKFMNKGQPYAGLNPFQSRNRGSFGFKSLHLNKHG